MAARTASASSGQFVAIVPADPVIRTAFHAPPLVSIDAVDVVSFAGGVQEVCPVAAGDLDVTSEVEPGVRAHGELQPSSLSPHERCPAQSSHGAAIVPQDPESVPPALATVAGYGVIGPSEVRQIPSPMSFTPDTRKRYCEPFVRPVKLAVTTPPSVTVCTPTCASLYRSTTTSSRT